VLPGEIPRLLDEPLTHSDSQSSFSNVDYAKVIVLIQEPGDSEDLFKGYLITALVLSYKAFNYWFEGLNVTLQINKTILFNNDELY
jgi:hypothetical protein